MSSKAGLRPENTLWEPPTTRTRAGVVQREINPPIGIRTASWGAAKRHVATGIHNAITTTAMAVIPEDGPVNYLVTVDWGWWQGKGDDLAVRGEVIKALNIEENQLMLHLTHTHAGPTTASDVAHEEGGEFVAAYHAKAISQIVAACEEARDQSVTVNITWAYGKCDLAVNRDLPCGVEDVLAYNPDVLADDTLTVGRVCDETGKVLGVVVNYACHPTTLAWANSKVSPDFVGEARILVQDRVKAPMLFLQGASGDLSPRDGFSGDTDLADKNGRILGFATLAVLEKMLPTATRLRFTNTVESGALLGEWTQEPFNPQSVSKTTRIDVEVPLQKLPTIEELQERWKDIDEGARETRIRRAMKLRAGYIVDGGATHPVWIWMWGDAVIVGQPGEAYSQFQTELRRRNPDRVISVLNCTNGPGYMYIPTPEAFERVRYQAWQTLLASGALELIIDATDQAIKSLPKN
ncbi:MAG: neutral/alkaline non-lysosomal ceramidase N-terminal domain-containing protein [Candidatus Nanopelagicaceae bacterium]|nr:neutral/alkaline non-lysosomal ceramidase N-terminal domain-containing protein [Candidatus Nanopelagicaceae bacterium]